MAVPYSDFHDRVFPGRFIDGFLDFQAFQVVFTIGLKRFPRYHLVDEMPLREIDAVTRELFILMFIVMLFFCFSKKLNRNATIAIEPD